MKEKKISVIAAVKQFSAVFIIREEILFLYVYKLVIT